MGGLFSLLLSYKAPARIKFLQVLVSSDLWRCRHRHRRKHIIIFPGESMIMIYLTIASKSCYVVVKSNNDGVKAVIWSETFLSSQYQKHNRNIKQNFFWQSQKLVSQSTINNFFCVAWENFCKNAKFWRYNFQFQGINFFFRKINLDKKERNGEKLLTPNIVTSSDQKFGKFHNGFRQVKCPEIKVKQKK